MAQPPQKSFTSLADIVMAQLGTLGKSKFAGISSIQKSWPNIAGSLLSEQTKGLMLKNDVLTVKLSSSVWVQESLFFKATLQEKIKTELNITLKDIKFTV